VLLYKPYDGKKYITMRYHSKDKIIEVKTEYIAKIIDYGRNYFSNGKTSTDKILTDYVCPSEKCAPNCGKNVGYNIIRGNIKNKNNTKVHWIFPNKLNVSHDLRLTNSIKPVLDELFNIKYDTNFGTPQDMTGDINNITTIFNLRDKLEDLLQKNTNKTKTVFDEIIYDATWTPAAIMDIFDDGRDYVFTVLPVL